MDIEDLWKCPRCGRSFKNKNQWHSCVSYSVADHFQEKPIQLMETFDYLISKIKQFGPLRVDAVKTGINLAAKSHFAMVFVQKDDLKLDFLSDRKLVDDRIVRTQKLDTGSRVYVNHMIKLKEKRDVDPQLLSWLKRSHFLKIQ
jgi:uncharacterized C2H2 Zn-finger protein